MTLSFTQTVEAAALIAAIIYCRKKDTYGFTLFIPFLAITLGTEMLALYLYNHLHRPNYIVYSIYMPLQQLFYSYMLYRWVAGRGAKVLISILAASATIFSVINV